MEQTPLVQICPFLPQQGPFDGGSLFFLERWFCQAAFKNTTPFLFLFLLPLKKDSFSPPAHPPIKKNTLEKCFLNSLLDYLTKFWFYHRKISKSANKKNPLPSPPLPPMKQQNLNQKSQTKQKPTKKPPTPKKLF